MGITGQISATEIISDEVQSQKSTDSLKPKTNRFQFGGYGEVVMSRYFYSDNFNRYTYPEEYKSSVSRGQFDLPHVVLYSSYDFGKGWKVSTEIEFEHGGAGSSIEIEADEFGEYESEIEKGGEIVLEQFWIEKKFSDHIYLRAGHIIVPIGLTNQHHMPTEFFTNYRPEEETSIIPVTWHETGVSLWGYLGKWRYEAMLIAGLDADRFNNANWIKGGGGSPYEFKLANAYAGVLRIDNYSVKGLRLGISGYYGHSAANSLKADRYKGLKGAVTLGSFDLHYNAHNFQIRGNIIYGDLTDSERISAINKNLPKASPSPKTNVASNAMCYNVEAGYDFFSFIPKLSQKQKFYLYVHYGFYDSMYKTEGKIADDARYSRHIAAAGINYYPIKNIVIKAEFFSRLFAEPYNTENTFSLGIAYSGLFDRS
jgi:hypothetical protein